MATVQMSEAISQIGESAGAIWQILSKQGPTPLTKLVKQAKAPRDVVMQALGWLAREDKIVIEEEGRSRVVSLAEE